MNKQKTKQIFGSRLSIVAALVLGVYLLVQMIAGVITGPRTVRAMRFTADDSFMATGWFFRDEVLVQGVASETVKHIVRNGEKVQKNAALAVVYTDTAALEASQKITLLDDEAALLHAAMQSSANNSDIAKLDQQIMQQLSAISMQANRGIVSGVETQTTGLRNLCLRRSAGDLDSATISAQLSALSTERNALDRQLVGRSTTIASPASGYFSEVVDGFEDKLTVQSLDALTVQSFNALQEPDAAKPQSGQLGKVISNFRWYFAVCVPQEELEGIQTGSTLRLRLSQMEGDVNVTVADIRKQKDAEEGLLIVSGMDITPALVTARHQQAEIIRSSVTGIRVPKNAVKIETDEKGVQHQGVYILPGSASLFKRIHILYEADTYYVVKQGTDQDTGLVAGDRIIVKARGLEDWKVVK